MIIDYKNFFRILKFISTIRGVNELNNNTYMIVNKVLFKFCNYVFLFLYFLFQSYEIRPIWSYVTHTIR